MGLFEPNVEKLAQESDVKGLTKVPTLQSVKPTIQV